MAWYIKVDLHRTHQTFEKTQPQKSPPPCRHHMLVWGTACLPGFKMSKLIFNKEWVGKNPWYLKRTGRKPLEKLGRPDSPPKKKTISCSNHSLSEENPWKKHKKRWFFVTFLSPIVGGHQQPLKRSRFHHPKIRWSKTTSPPGIAHNVAGTPTPFCTVPTKRANFAEDLHNFLEA